MNGGRYLWIIKEWRVRRNYSFIFLIFFLAPTHEVGRSIIKVCRNEHISMGIIRSGIIFNPIRWFYITILFQLYMVLPYIVACDLDGFFRGSVGEILGCGCQLL